MEMHAIHSVLDEHGDIHISKKYEVLHQEDILLKTNEDVRIFDVRSQPRQNHFHYVRFAYQPRATIILIYTQFGDPENPCQSFHSLTPNMNEVYIPQNDDSGFEMPRFNTL